MAKLNKTVSTTVKVLISALLLYFVFTKINFTEVRQSIGHSNRGFLGIALLFFVLSKIFAAFRLNLYFREIGVILSHSSNLKLYVQGMFYNLFLPGGIGGDAYKGYRIKKEFEVKTKRVVSVLVLDRLSGLLLLFIYACTLACFLRQEILRPFTWLFMVAIPISLGVFWLMNKRFFNFILTVFWKSLLLSALVQLAQLVSILFIILALGITTDIIAYLVLFLISSIIAVIPLTLGGIGSREVTFFYGAQWLGLDENLSISVSFIFFLVTALVSLVGIYYHFKKIPLHGINKKSA